MKDIYDIYILINYNKEKIDFENLILSIKNTFKHKGTKLNVNDIKEQIENMKTSNELIKLWNNCQKIASYSSNISFDELFDSLKYITNMLCGETVAS